MKTCKDCKLDKDLQDFQKVSVIKNKIYYRANCKSCFNNKRYGINQGKVVPILDEMLYQARKRAKRKNIEFDITKEFIIELIRKQNNKCHYTGWELNWDKKYLGKKRTCPPDRASIDRLDNTKGYTKDNVVICCDIANRAKSSYTLLDFISMCESVISKHHKLIVS